MLERDERAISSTDSTHSAETLARVVVRCRDLANYLESSADQLPKRGDTPFLHSQLDDVLKRLQSALRPLWREEPAAERAPSFLRLLRRAPPERKSEPRYDLEGSAWSIPVTELVGFLSHSGKSGLLWITGTSETFVLEFARGSLVYATSNAPPAALRLGEILVAEKLLEAHELAHMIDQAKAADDLLGSFLMRTGRISQADMQRALTFQVQQLFHRLMDATDALFRFQEGAQLLRSHELDVSITQLLLESARKKDEERQEASSAAAGLAVLEELATTTPTEPPGNEPVAALPTPLAAPAATPAPEPAADDAVQRS